MGNPPKIQTWGEMLAGLQDEVLKFLSGESDGEGGFSLLAAKQQTKRL
jgi:hypothetical protein